MRFTWNLKKRELFKRYLEQDYTLSKIADLWSDLGEEYQISAAALGREVKLGLTAQEYSDRRWAKYDITKVYEHIIGQDAVEYIRKNKENANE